MNAVVSLPTLRTPPASVPSEQAVIGAVLLVPDALTEIAEILREEDFYTHAHRLIWRAIRQLSAGGQPFDAVTLGEWFERNGGTASIGGIAYLSELANNTASAANVCAYAEIVAEKSARRRLIGFATELGGQGFGAEGDAATLIDRAIADLMAMQRNGGRWEHSLRETLGLAMEDAQKAAALPPGAIPGIHTGLHRLDDVLGGWHDSDLTVVGARPAMGKTALMLNFALASGVPCGVVSAEQPATQIGARLMSIESRVPAVRMRNGRFEEEDMARLDRAARAMLARTCMVYDRSAPTIADVARIARKWKHQHGIKVLLVDYLQRIRAVNCDKRTPKHERVGEVAQGLKDLARDLAIPVIALGQVSRAVEERKDKRPGMGDLSDSSEIEKEADQIIMLFRASAYEEAADNTAELSVEKNRHGPTGLVRCVWLAETMRFVEMTNHG